MRLHSKRNTSEGPENAAYISELLSRVKKSSRNHEFGLLYNAFTEPSFGEKFKYLSGFDHTHADSGGLQIITQGKSITDELKDQVYRNQAKNADLGMCFDEIPIGTLNATSGRNDVDNRWFKPDEMEHYARETGRNIKRQIEIFHEEGSACKPILIAQGNCYETYMKWVEYALDEIPKSDHKYIGGVAMGAAALGTGPLEDIERAFIFSQLPIDKSHLHILGVGAARRMLPYMVFMQNGAYNGVTVSYDSTTHTSGVELGLFYLSTRETLSFTRAFDRNYETLYNEVATLGTLDGIDVRAFHEVMNYGYTRYVEELGKKDFDYMRVRTSFTMKSIMNFVDYMDDLYEKKDVVLAAAIDAKMHGPIKHLYDVKTKQDWDYWLSHFSRAVKSNRVQVGAPQSLAADVIKPTEEYKKPKPKKTTSNSLEDLL
jgi:hypothetical protein